MSRGHGYIWEFHAVILLPLNPAALTHGNPKRRKVIYGMLYVFYHAALIFLVEIYFFYKNMMPNISHF